MHQHVHDRKAIFGVLWVEKMHWENSCATHNEPCKVGGMVGGTKKPSFLPILCSSAFVHVGWCMSVAF